jgi:PAS domain S-box-containing protein
LIPKGRGHGGSEFIVPAGSRSDLSQHAASAAGRGAAEDLIQVAELGVSRPGEPRSVRRSIAAVTEPRKARMVPLEVYGDARPGLTYGGWPAINVAPSGLITGANDAFARLIGRDASDLHGQSLFDLIQLDDFNTAAALLQQTNATPVELRFLAAGGEEHFLILGPQNGVASTPSRTLLACDVTSYRAAEKVAGQGELAARADARRYSEIIQSASDWVWEMDSELRYTYFSPNLQKLTSIVPETIIGKRRDEIGDPSFKPEKWAEHFATLRSHKPFRDFVYRSMQPDGRALWIKVSGTPVFGEHGRFTGYRGISTDVTAQLATEHAVAESEKRLRELFEVASDWFWETDAQGRFTFLSSAWSRVTGQDPQEYLGRRRDEFGDRVEDPEAWREHLATLAAHKPFRDFTYCMRSASGARRWVRTSGIPYFDESGAFIGYRGAATDVTAEMSAEEALRRSEKLFAAVFQATPAMLAMSGLDDGRFIDVNIGFLRVLGYERDAIVGRTRSEIGLFVDPDLPHRLVEGLSDTSPQRDIVAAVLTRRREVREILISAQVVRFADRDMLLTVGRDVTERRREEEELRQSKAIAEFANHSKSEFLANMSHEIRTPLNAIIGFSEVIMGEVFGPVGTRRYAEYATDIWSSGTHLLQIINDLLDLSKLDAGKLELHETEVSLPRLVETGVRLVRERAVSAGVAIDVELSAELPTVRADERVLKQILINLLSNSVKFTPRGGRISVGGRRTQSGAVELAVADTGIGMSADEIEIALAPFGQVESALTRKHQGTGLGLPLARSLTELHGGRLEVRSTPGAGTMITVSLPPERALAPEYAGEFGVNENALHSTMVMIP